MSVGAQVLLQYVNIMSIFGIYWRQERQDTNKPSFYYSLVPAEKKMEVQENWHSSLLLTMCNRA